MNILKNRRTFIVLSLLILTIWSGLIYNTFAVFTVGQTNNPACGPADPTCYVDITAVFPPLNSGLLFVGNASNIATGVALSGDANISNTGVLTLTADSVDTAELTNLSVTNAKIANSSIDLTTKVTGILPIANGGTGSSTQNFVDLTTAQSIAGAKTFTGNLAQTGATTFSTGTGAISLNGATSITGTNTLTVGTGATTLGGSLGVTGSTTLAGLTNVGTVTSTGGAINLNASSNFATNIGTGTTTSAVAIGGGSNTLAIDTSVWDITSAGVVSGLTGITNTGAVTTSGGAVSINDNSNFATSIGTGTTTAAVTIGGGANTLAIDTSTWDITSAGVASGLTGITNAGALSQTGTTNINTTGAATTTIGSGTSSTIIDGVLTVNGDQTNTGNISQTGATTFSTGTGVVSLNGNTSVTGTNTFTVGTGTATFGGAVTSTGNATIATGASTTNTFGSGASATNTIGGGNSSVNNIGTGTGATNTIGNPTGSTTFDGTVTFNIAPSLPLNSGLIFVGNALNIATAVTVSGDVTIDNLGATTIGLGKVTNAMLAGSIDLSKINSGSSIVTSLTTPTGSNANGGSITNNVLTLSLADDINPGIVSTGTQSFIGEKTFQSATNINGLTTITSGTTGVSNLRLSQMIIPEADNTVKVGSQPYYIVTDLQDNIYTVNLAGNNITKITPSGVMSVFAPVGVQPLGAVFDTSNNMYVTNNLDDNVIKITPEGIITTYASVVGSRPTAITIDSSGNLYVANYNHNTVTKITGPNTSSVLGSTGQGPSSIGVDSMGNVYTVNAITSDVTKITPGGISSQVTTIPSSPNPRLAIDSQDNVYVTATTSLIKITSGGSVSTVATPTLNYATGITIDSGDNIYITNHPSSNTAEVIKIDTFGTATTVLSHTASGIAAYTVGVSHWTGSVYMADRTNSTLIISPNVNTRSKQYLTTDNDGDVIFENLCDRAMCNGGNRFGNDVSASIGTLDFNSDLVFLTAGIEGLRLKSSPNGIAGNFSLQSFSNDASGLYSTAFGKNTYALSYAETSLGMNTTTYTPSVNPRVFYGGERLFTIGNGDGDATDQSGMGVWSDTSDAFTILKNGLTGIGISNFETTADTELLQVGTSSITGGVARFTNNNGSCIIDPTTSSVGCTSDIRMKKNITSLDSNATLDKVLRLQGVNFNWNSDSDDTRKNIGFIAQQLEQEFPEFVMTDINGYKAVAYGSLTPVLVESIKRLNLNITDIAKTDTPNSWREALINWFASATNGIKKLIVHDELCIDDVCMTKDQLRTMLQNSTTTPAVSSSNGSGNTNPIIENTDNSTDTTDSTADTSSDSPDTPIVDTTSDTTDTTIPDTSIDDKPVEEIIVPVLDTPIENTSIINTTTE